MTQAGRPGAQFSLEIQRVIAAQPERVFNAWTDPAEVRLWWGPAGVHCLSADIDLRVGGHYRIQNKLPDESILWISGTFETIESPNLLVYTWRVETSASAAVERVTVAFSPHKQGTQLTLTHQRIPDGALRDQHEQGWYGCLDGLSRYLDH